MTTQEGNNAVVARHLEALANAAKNYTLAELANVSVGGASYAEATTVSSGLMSAADKVKLDNLTNYTLPTASETLKGGVKIGSGLSMDGDTLSVTIQSGSAGGTVLDTVPSTVDGGLWYEETGSVPALWLHKGNYDYRYSHDKLRFSGNSSENLVAYLPFTSTLDDVLGNEWTASGSPTITDGKLSLNGSSYLVNSNVADAIGANSWTIDCWATLINSRESCLLFHANNVLNAPGSKNSMVCLGVRYGIGGEVYFEYCNATKASSQTVAAGTRHHYAATYDGTTLRAFFDGNLVIEDTRQITLGGQFCIGRRNDNYFYWNGTIDHFRVFDGVALWTSNFTPPTANDYA